jgi:hypothetical protein
MNTQIHPRPSPQARELVRGAYDLYVHTSPDVNEQHQVLPEAQRVVIGTLLGVDIKEVSRW